jgi:serine/threonine protein kinase
MSSEGAAGQFQVLEELGSGSFGVVYKAIERSTGEIVAIKHVSPRLDTQWIERELTLSRLISNLARMISRRSSRRYQFSALAPVHMSRNTKPVSSADTSYGL